MCLYFYGKHGDFGCFSNFYVRQFVHDGVVYSSAEQAMMHRKALLFGDKATAEAIMVAQTPSQCKQLGRKVRPYDDEKWSKKRYDIVIRILADKFGQNADLGEQLAQTFPKQIAEASPTDKVWGIGLGVAAAKAGIKWRGRNLLGKALMEVRKKHLNAHLQWDPPIADVHLVAEHCGVFEDKAIATLRDNDGDVVNAMIALEM